MMYAMSCNIICIFSTLFFFNLPNESIAWPFGFGSDDEWKGGWFPYAEGHSDTNVIQDYPLTKTDLHDDQHGIKMGVPSSLCDDGKLHLDQDWLDDPANFTCYDDKKLYLPRDDVYPIFATDHIPMHYSAQHKCMDKEIIYDTDIPTFGAHRPLWAKYGEYKFLPRQRWIHNLEHGAIVMLYHPCANGEEVNLLRQIVVNCLYRHIITPYNMLTPERPLALVAWGQKLVMSEVDIKMVQEFIRISAKHGAEHTAKDGQYDHELLQHALIVTTRNDDVICSDFTDAQTME